MTLNLIDVAHALLEEHRDRTGHEPYELEKWNFCDVCLHLMPLAKQVIAEHNAAEWEALREAGLVEEEES